ncbi:hypothetical protein [Nocardia sp. NPDC049149]|uniref:hypothetical protein n=1 Tax=Nocardia sp. NPDC049149 TaxID=3364315 RepID=UPI00371600A3
MRIASLLRSAAVVAAGVPILLFSAGPAYAGTQWFSDGDPYTVTVACALDDAQVWCVASFATYQLPIPAPTCEAPAVPFPKFTLARTGTTQLSYACGTGIYRPGPQLPPGNTITNGPITCTGQPPTQGIQCTNGQHTFRISRTQYTLT